MFGQWAGGVFKSRRFHIVQFGTTLWTLVYGNNYMSSSLQCYCFHLLNEGLCEWSSVHATAIATGCFEYIDKKVERKFYSSFSVGQAVVENENSINSKWICNCCERLRWRLEKMFTLELHDLWVIRVSRGFLFKTIAKAIDWKSSWQKRYVQANELWLLAQ